MSEKQVEHSSGILPVVKDIEPAAILERIKGELLETTAFIEGAKQVECLDKTWKNLKIQDDKGVGIATVAGMEAKKRGKAIKDTINPLIKKLHTLKSGLTEFRADYLLPLELFEKEFKEKIGNYQLEQKRKRKAKIAAAEKAARDEEATARQAALEEAAALENEGDHEGARETFADIDNIHVGMVMPDKVENVTKTALGKSIGREGIEIEIYDEDKAKEYIAKLICGGEVGLFDCISIKLGAFKIWIHKSRIAEIPGVKILKKVNVAFQVKK